MTQAHRAISAIPGLGELIEIATEELPQLLRELRGEGFDPDDSECASDIGIARGKTDSLRPDRDEREPESGDAATSFCDRADARPESPVDD